jgi:hypothetical protein
LLRPQKKGFFSAISIDIRRIAKRKESKIMTKKTDGGFKLCFSDEGVLVDVEPPAGSKLKFGPTLYSRLSFEQLREKNITLKDGSQQNFEDLLGVGNIKMEMILVNLPGNSICGGDCGGRAFCWC